MFSILDDNFFYKSFLLIGNYLKYVLLIVPVGFFINQISSKKFTFDMIFFIYFIVYISLIMVLANQYDKIEKLLNTDSSITRVKLVLHSIYNSYNIKNIFDIIIFCFILTFGVFIEDYWNIFILSVFIYSALLIKFDIFDSVLMVVIVSLFCIVSANLFYILYASIFLYIYFLIKKFYDDGAGNIDEFSIVR